MPNPFHYRAVINRLARLTDAPYPPHVQVAAAVALSNELTPGSDRARLAQRLLMQANPFEFARHQLRDLYDRHGPISPHPAEQADDDCPEEQETPDEPEDPL